MDSKHPPDHSISTQQTQGAKDGPRPPQIPWLERFLKRIGFFEHKYNAMYEPYTTLTVAFYRPLILYCLGS